MRGIALGILAILVTAHVGLAQKAKPAQRPLQPPATKQTTKSDAKATDKDEEAQVGDETLRLGTELVNVLFSVLDGNNRVVSDVRQEDVTVLEDGKPQRIFTFKREATLPLNIAILIDLSGSQEYTFPQE